MKKKIQKWLGVSALKALVSVLTENMKRTEERLFNIERALRSVNEVRADVGMAEVKQAKEVERVSEFTPYRLGPKGNFEVLNLTTGQFLVGDGFKSQEKALDAAKELCIKYPTVEFGVYGILSTVKADIPIIHTSADGTIVSES